MPHGHWNVCTPVQASDGTPDKLSLSCFNAGDVPELIGRLDVALSPENHKTISLPMFRRGLGVRKSSLLELAVSADYKLCENSPRPRWTRGDYNCKAIELSMGLFGIHGAP